MGACKCKCQISQNQPVFEIVYQKKKKDKSSSSQREKRETSTALTQKKSYYKETINSIGNEFQASEDNSIPEFIQTKQVININPPRTNRFIEDMEQEVKYRIMKIQEEEQLERMKYEQNLFFAQIQKKNQEIQEEVDKQLNNFNETKKENYQENIIENQENQQINNNELVIASSFDINLDQQNQEQNIKNLNQNEEKQEEKQIGKEMDELCSNEVQQGSSSLEKNSQVKQNISKKQLKALDKLFSDYFFQDRTMFEVETRNKSKSILKYRTFSGGRNSRSTSNKTQKSQKSSCNTSNARTLKKRVRFSQDTNFNFERKYQKQFVVQQNSWYQFW